MRALTLQNVFALSVQITCIVAAATLILALSRVQAPGLRYAYWRVVSALCLLLPWLQTPLANALSAPAITGDEVSVATTVESVGAVSQSPVDWTFWLLGLLLTGVIARIAWMAIGMFQLQQLRATGVCAVSNEHADLQRSIGTRAEVRYAAAVQQPVTFGLARPVVLLPASLRQHPPAIRDAVLTHELLHVRRRDWLWVLGEELVRAVFWFHPAMWWLIAQVQLAREEVVDTLAVTVTGQRREYVEALLAFADTTPLAPAPAFARRRQLFHRIVLISTEDVMSARHLVAWSFVMAVVVALGTTFSVGAFPMQLGFASSLQFEPGAIEQAAKPASPTNPIPLRVSAVSPEYPPVAPRDATVVVTLRTTVDESGVVAEMRLTGFELAMQGFEVRMSGGASTMGQLEQFFKGSLRATSGQSIEANTLRPAAEAFIDAAARAVQQWRYARPMDGPITFDTMVRFSGGTVTERSRMPLGAAANANGALRVGGSIKTPQKIVDARPVYPEEARAQGVQGVVIAEVHIQEDGRVGGVQVLRSIPLLDQAAIDAIQQWEFTPTLLNGVAVPVIMTVTVQFTTKQ